MMKDIVMFDTMYQRNLEYFKELQLYIKAGEEKILELQQHTIPKIAYGSCKFSKSNGSASSQ